MLDQYGVNWRGTRPLARLRKAHEVMRRFLADGRIDFEGDFYRYSGLFTAASPVQQALPLKIGAMKGPGSFRLAGEITDGVHVACTHSRERSPKPMNSRAWLAHYQVQWWPMTWSAEAEECMIPIRGRDHDVRGNSLLDALLATTDPGDEVVLTQHRNAFWSMRSQPRR
jgi:hypothetical protein